jgi:hypothetical protein
VGPRTGQARQAVFVLREFDLQHTFSRAGVLCEDIQDQCGTVQHSQVITKDCFKLALVTGRELLVEEYDIGKRLIRLAANFLDLP